MFPISEIFLYCFRRRRGARTVRLVGDGVLDDDFRDEERVFQDREDPDPLDQRHVGLPRGIFSCLYTYIFLLYTHMYVKYTYVNICIYIYIYM